MVSISSQLIQKVENAVYHAPYMIPTLFKESKAKRGFLHSRFRRYVPHRVGIEFECFNEFANQYIISNKRSWTNFESFERYFNILDFNQDTEIRYDSGRKFKNSFIGSHEEIRVSIQDYRQLNGLYNILNEMAKYCAISDDCGIHIHIDLTKYSHSCQKDKAVEWFNKHLDEVESIFPKYQGSYNKKGAKRGKGYWINISGKDTIEFRTAPLTFDYELLITWIIKCSKLVSRMISECHLEKLINSSTYKSLVNNEIPLAMEDIPCCADNSDSLQYDIPADRIDASVHMDFQSACTENHITWRLSGDNLLLTQIDGSELEINFFTALRLFPAGGIDSVISGAHPISSDHSTVISGSNIYSSALTGTTTSDSWTIMNNGVSYSVHGVSSDSSDWFNYF